MSSGKKIVLSFISLTIPAGLNFILYLVLARTLGAEGRGFVAAALAPSFLLVSCLQLGLPEARVYFGSRNQALSRNIRFMPYGIALAVFSAAIVIVFVLRNSLAGGNTELAAALVITSLLVPFQIFAALGRGSAQADDRWMLVVAERIVGAVARFALPILVLFLIEPDLTLISLSVALGTSLSCIVYLLCSNSGLKSDRENVSLIDYFSYSIRIWSGSITGILLLRLDQVMLPSLSSVEQLGYYVVAVNISEVVLLFNSALKEVLFRQQSAEMDIYGIARQARVSTIVVVLASLGIGGSSFILLPAFFGPAFHPSIMLLCILLCGIALGNPGSLAGVALSAMGKPLVRSAGMLFAVFLNVAILAALAPTYGALAAALSTMVASTAAGMLNVYFVSKSAGLKSSYFIVPRKQDFGFLKKKLLSRISRFGA